MALYVPLEYSHHEQETLSCWYIVDNPVHNLCFNESNWFLAPFWGFRSSINKNLWWLPRFLCRFLFSRLFLQDQFLLEKSNSNTWFLFFSLHERMDSHRLILSTIKEKLYFAATWELAKGRNIIPPEPYTHAQPSHFVLRPKGHKTKR